MHLKPNGYCLGVLLIYTVTTITLAPLSRCEPGIYSSQPNSHLAPHHGGKSALTTSGLTQSAKRGGTGRTQLESRLLPNLRQLENRDETQTERDSKERPARTLGHRMATVHTDKTHMTPQQSEGQWRYTALSRPSNEDCVEGKVKHVTHGKFYVRGQLEANIPNLGFQADSALSGQERIGGQRPNGSERSWQMLQPLVECGVSTMTLTVRRRRAVQLFLDRVNESSVPLSQLPPQCGYSVQTTWRDLSLVAQYDACHVMREEDGYVLPLLWRGTPVRMSCPAPQIQPEAVGPPSPPSLCCSPYGMTVKVHGVSATEELRVNVREEWTSLLVLAEQCGYTLDKQDTGIVITAPFITCGITVKDGKHTLSLQVGDKMFRLTCPVSPTAELPLTSSPDHLTREPTEHTVPQSLEPFPWAPPFYLAPPYYPHPTYRHKYQTRDGQDAPDPPSPSSSTPEPLPPVDSQPDYQDYYSHQITADTYKPFGVRSSLSSTDDLQDSSQVYPDLEQSHETPLLLSPTHSPSSDTGFPSPVEALPLQPPSNAFSQYYHYYHHPKIPNPDLDSGPPPGSSTNPHNPGFPQFPPRVQQSEAFSRVNSDQILQPAPEFASHPYTLPTSAPYTTYPPQLYPYFYFFPHMARGQAKRLALLNTAGKTFLSDRQNTKSSTFVHPLPHSSQIHDVHPYTDQPNHAKTIHHNKNSPEYIKHSLLSDSDGGNAKLQPPGTDAVAAPPPGQPSLHTPAPKHYFPPYLYYYHHPYSHYHHMYYGPQSLLNTENPVSPASSKVALDSHTHKLHTSSTPAQHPSYVKPQTPSLEPFDDHHSLLHPYYYHHLFYQPKVSVDKQEVHPAGSMNSNSESLLVSDSDYSWMAGYPSMPQSNLFYSLFYSHDFSRHHPQDPFGRPDGGAEEVLDTEIKDHLKANTYTPSASPCGLGPVSDFECSLPSGCCTYRVKDCTMGQHLIFAVPASVVEPTVAPSALPSEVSNVSCTLQRLTSDPDVYAVPLVGCGVIKHAFGQAVVHLVEVHGIQSLQQDHSSGLESSPVRLMVECSSSPGSPGEVRLCVLDQHPPLPTPATVTVQLRVATDETFTSFHPEAHLPLSMLQGRPVYVEVKLLDPPEPDLVLLVHSCLAHTQAPYSSWMSVYDSCQGRRRSQLLPSPYSRHIQRLIITNFLSLASESHTYMADRGPSHLEDPEIFFLCLTEVCSTADGDCTVGCFNSPNSNV